MPVTKLVYSEQQTLLEARRILRRRPDQATFLLEHIGRDAAYAAFKVMAKDLDDVHKVVAAVIDALKPIIRDNHASDQAPSHEAPEGVPGPRPDH